MPDRGRSMEESEYTLVGPNYNNLASAEVTPFAVMFPAETTPINPSLTLSGSWKRDATDGDDQHMLFSNVIMHDNTDLRKVETETDNRKVETANFGLAPTEPGLSSIQRFHSGGTPAETASANW